MINDFRFQSPAYLLLLVALPLLFMLINWLGKRNNNILLQFASSENLKKLLSGATIRGSIIKQYAYSLGLILLVLALARPQGNPHLEERDNASLDIMVLLDVSRSMDAEDVPPSRLKKAKKTISHLMDLLSGDRVGIIAFAGSAVLVSPLTADYDMVKTFLQNVDTSIIANQGTNLQAAFGLALKAMERGSAAGDSALSKSQVFILMSDGEDHHQADLIQVEEIKKKGGVVFSIAFGTEKGVPIPLRDERGELMGYKLDASHQPVISKVEPKSMQEAADLGGGHFYYSTLDEGEVQDILARIQDMQRDGTSSLKAKIYEEYFFPILLAGILLLLYSFDAHQNIFAAFSTIKKVPIKNLKRKTNLLLFLAFFITADAMANPLSFLWEKEKRVSSKSAKEASEGKLDEAVNTLKALQAENPDSPELNYNIGTYLVQNKNYQEGREQLKRNINKDNPIHKEALFNLAGSYAQEGKKDEAKASYAELVDELSKLEKPTKADEKLLADARKNLKRLADSKNNQSQQNQQEQNQQNQQNQEQNKGGSGENKKDNNDNKKKDGDQNKEEKKEENKDQQNDQNKDENKPKQNGQKPQYGRQPFKERENMSESDAKRIMEALKQQESRLQKSFLKKKDKDNNGHDDEDAKDW